MSGMLVISICACTAGTNREQAFRDYLTPLQQSTIRKATKAKGTSFENVLRAKLIGILSRCRQIPNPVNLSNQLVQIARYEFMITPNNLLRVSLGMTSYSSFTLSWILSSPASLSSWDVAHQYVN